MGHYSEFKFLIKKNDLLIARCYNKIVKCRIIDIILCWNITNANIHWHIIHVKTQFANGRYNWYDSINDPRNVQSAAKALLKIYLDVLYLQRIKSLSAPHPQPHQKPTNFFLVRVRVRSGFLFAGGTVSSSHVDL